MKRDCLLIGVVSSLVYVKKPLENLEYFFFFLFFVFCVCVYKMDDAKSWKVVPSEEFYVCSLKKYIFSFPNTERGIVVHLETKKPL